MNKNTVAKTFTVQTWSSQTTKRQNYNFGSRKAYETLPNRTQNRIIVH